MKGSVVARACAGIALVGLGLSSQLAAQTTERPHPGKVEEVEIAPASSLEVGRRLVRVEDSPLLSHDQKLELLRQKIKYVFVLFQENRSFDFYFGTYPGARGLFSQTGTPGFKQPIVLKDGSVGTISPFKIPQSVTDMNRNTVWLYPEDIDSVNHGHSAIDRKLDVVDGVVRNDRYAFEEQGLKGKLSADGRTYTGPAPTEKQVQKGELVMGHVDCDTAPFLWRYADRFTLFDNFFDTVIGPSTPNAIAMIAGQSGETQWVKHPELSSKVNTTGAQLPMTADPEPFWGSALDLFTPPADRQPTDNPGGVSANPAANLTFASLPLSFMGDQITTITAHDLDPAFDLLDVHADIQKIQGEHNKPVHWGWFQEGYDHEPTDRAGATSNGDYIAHHNAPQYFGYEADNPEETRAHLKGLGDFYAAINSGALPVEGGVFYVRGGYGNLDGLIPRSSSPAVKAAFGGNDDHPGYSDTQISEALLADSINAIAGSPYWAESAILITYDESDGLFDHALPKIRSFDPMGKPLDQGPRIPMILISPYARAHAISHEATEHGSLIKFIDELFHLTPLAELPDELAAREEGKKQFHQDFLGPSDALTPGVGDLFSGFEDARLTGKMPALPPDYAAILPAEQITKLPHASGEGCKALEITPTDTVNGRLIDPAPDDFNPRPSTNPGVPTSGGWPSN